MHEKNDQKAVRSINYIMQMRPVFNIPALFSDETENYVTPMEPDPGEEVKIFFRTAHNNVDEIWLCCREERKPMEYDRSDGIFDYYRVCLQADAEPIEYYFEIRSGRFTCYYNKLGMSEHPTDEFRFCVCPGFHTPDWAKGAVMYQILMDRFCNGDPSNDVLDREYAYIEGQSARVTDWFKRPASMGVREFYGGDIEGVLAKLDYLQDLGIEVLYFNPLFVSPSNHKYDIQDYDYIDPHFGPLPLDEGELLQGQDLDNTHASRYITRVTRKENLEAANALFAHMVEECHKRGIRVILDGVFNHCGSFNKWMDRERIYEFQEGYAKGAYISADSPYRSFFRFEDTNAWPYNPRYEGWWGHNTLPKLNYEDSPVLEEYILQIARKWVSPPYNADGWRLDVAADLGYSLKYNHAFWTKFRNAVKEANPEAVILAEHYGDPHDWLNGKEWDSVMNYDAFMEPLTWFFTGMEKHSDHRDDGLLGNADFFMNAMHYNMARFMAPSLQASMNELSNHDHSRFLTRTNGKVGRMDHFNYDAACDGVRPEVMREAIVMQMTWPGAPTLYYGDEAGVCGFTDPDNRRTYPWGREDQRMLSFYKEAIRIHRTHPVLKSGSLIFLLGDYNVLSYARFSEQEKIVVLFNNNAEERYIDVRVWTTGLADGDRLVPILQTQAGEASPGTWPAEEYCVSEGYMKIRMPEMSALVLCR